MIECGSKVAGQKLLVVKSQEIIFSLYSFMKIEARQEIEEKLLN
jgi:hypothetical protein